MDQLLRFLDSLLRVTRTAHRVPVLGQPLAAEDGTHNQDLLCYYGTSIAAYRGTGTLRCEGCDAQECRFQAGQLNDGTVLLFCHFSGLNLPVFQGLPVAAFHGAAISGATITAGPPFINLNYLPASSTSDAPATYVAYRLHELHVKTPVIHDPAQVRFGLTNFQALIPLPGRLVLNLRHVGRTSVCELQPVPHHSQVMLRVKTLRTSDVVAEAVFDLTEPQPVGDLEELLSDLCCVLSVARGTKVQWIYRDLYSRSGALLSRAHLSRLTMPYSMFHTIDPGIHGVPDLIRFVDEAFPVYLERCEPWRLREMIDGYLDAKAESGFTELRGVKLAVVLEALKDQFLHLPPTSIGEYLVTERVFKQIRRTIRKALQNLIQSDSTSDDVRQTIRDNLQEIESKLPELNRRSFRGIMQELCRYIGLDLGSEMDVLIKSRNSLVHAGEFYSTTAQASGQTEAGPFASYLHEYLFLMNVLDRLFLRLLGYRGSYIDWRQPGQPTRRPLVMDGELPAESNP